jgi:hypothetical protein
MLENTSKNQDGFSISKDDSNMEILLKTIILVNVI